jgi:catechol 2,3-dioxygenase-like lactoylglutathione lyase family enzyme
MDYRLEVVAVPVSNIDAAKDLYERIGYHIDQDHRVSDESLGGLHALQRPGPLREGARRSATGRQRPACRRLDAREQLRAAHRSFTEFGMEAFAERARAELEATGEHARKRTAETRDDLTRTVVATASGASRESLPPFYRVVSLASRTNGHRRPIATCKMIPRPIAFRPA